MSNERKLSIVLITMDRKSSCFVFTRSDGREERVPFTQSPFDDTSALARLCVTPALSALVAVTLTDDKIFFELPTADGADRLAGRLVVYLDQNMWSSVSHGRRRTAKSNPKDQEAARQLDEWVQQHRIVLPVSAGHFYETGKWSDTAERYQLGLAVMQLSRGWQMRDPLQVRRDELHDALRRRSGSALPRRVAPVFTLEPNALYSPSRGMATYAAPFDLSPDIAFATEALTAAAASIDTMLDAECRESGADTGWTAHSQRFSDWLDGQDLDSQQKRKAVDAFLLADVQHEIADEALRVSMRIEELQAWISKHAMKDVGELPALGLFREMLHERHLNPGTRWRPNDLTDMIYLSCAAGYADFVACERHMGATLAQGIRRRKRKTPVYRRLVDVVEAIGASLDTRQAPQ